MKRFLNLTCPPNEGSQIFTKTTDELLDASKNVRPNHCGNVTDFSDWVYSLYQKGVTPAKLAQHAAMEVHIDRQRKIEKKNLWRFRSTLSGATPGWKLKYKHFADNNAAPLKISDLKSRAFNLFGKPDLVFSNKKGVILIVEIKMTSAIVPKDGWPNLGAQLWAYANADIFKAAPKVLLGAEIWGYSVSKPQYITYDFYDEKFQDSNNRLFERYLECLTQI